jgi:hypothetical protein
MANLKNPLLWFILVFAAPCLWHLGLVLIFAGVAVNAHIQNDRRIEQQAQRFDVRLKHPPNTVEIKQHRNVGLLGNGNSCSYFVGEIRQFYGDRAPIKAAYAGQFVQLEFLESGRFSQRVPFGLGDLTRWSIAAPTSSQQWYLVYELDFDLDFADDFDMRCT